jgi:hypothetical protein
MTDDSDSKKICPLSEPFVEQPASERLSRSDEL